ncbi:MAG: ATP synthase F1 subunit epsilon [Bacteroidota bacterium]
MFLEIITPDKKVFEGEVNIVTFPGTDGSFQVMNDHAPMISSLATGKVEYKGKDTEEIVEISGGVVEVLNNRVILLADGLVNN